jgi:RNA-directed DNA polymerase
MNVQAIRTCAASHQEVQWHSIDWVSAYKTVRRLQARIVKATCEGRWGKVKALQYLLTRSLSAKAVAVRRVTENTGKRTPGVDGVLWSSPGQKTAALKMLKRRGYRPLPLRRIHIPKANGKLRPLGIPTMRDRAMQALHKLALDPIAETTADPNSYGFRPGRSTADAREQLFILLSRRNAAEWIVEGDIKGCFDNISHDWMLANIPMDKVVLRKWLKSGFMEQGTLFDTESGTPQGGPISPVLANMVLDGLEDVIRKQFPERRKVKGIEIRSKVHVVRYADDFIVTAGTRELAEEILPVVQKFMAGRGLELSQEKTRITHIDEGFDFLGWNARKYGGKLLIKPAKKNVKHFLDKVRGIIKAYKTALAGSVIDMLNPLIQGWANYHQFAVASKTFSRVDTVIWESLWRWALRRHPNKSRKWIKAKYFAPIGPRNWVFNTGEVTGGQDAQERRKVLRLAADVKINHSYVKVLGNANFYDPKWDRYFEQRITARMELSIAGRKKIAALWSRQEGRCPVCEELITVESGWHVHHTEGRQGPNADALYKLRLLHPNCHMQTHFRRDLS